MSLVDELRADQDPRAGRCKFCFWLETRSPEEQVEWRAVIVDRSFTVQSIHRAAYKRGWTGSSHTVEHHRKAAHE